MKKVLLKAEDHNLRSSDPRNKDVSQTWIPWESEKIKACKGTIATGCVVVQTCALIFNLTAQKAIS